MSGERAKLGQVALDWVDAFLVVAVCVAWSIVLHVAGLSSTFARAVVAAVAIVVLVGRRRLFGAPKVPARGKTSVVGSLAAILVVFGLLGGALGVYLLFRDAGAPPPTRDAADAENPFGDPDLDARRRAEDVARRRLELAIAIGGMLLIACGGKLDEWWTKRRD